ncbi:hypothetical protein [Hydrogenophaga sp.]|uniref:hypothetical protein n=1 Tax=Hydrogenophaga sp. TaxID=1904254 RepID=UPI0027185B41|nr:hypothetical protein [Hydrogenophaga sp.]MDO8906567.1 hypothetical protein [Hydrogenophaga sp.]
MISAQDDLIGHQAPAPFAERAGNGDTRFTERYWYTLHPITGTVDGTPMIIDIGMGYYPNKGVMDVFAGITMGRKQHNFRATRTLGDTPLHVGAGPLRIDVVEGAKLHRLTLMDNDSGFSFALDFEASFPVAQEKQNYRERKGQVEEDMVRTMQFGRWQGWFVINGTSHEVTPQTWWGQRDHSWGIRSEMRTDEAAPPVQQHSSFFWTWSMFQFEDRGISIFLKEREPGKPHYLSASEFVRAADGSVTHREATGATHDLTWADDPLGQTILAGSFTLTFAEGPPLTVRMEGQEARFYLKGGLYGGFKGWNHGDHKGDYHAEHDVWDLDDADTRARARTLGDHVVRATCDGRTGIGISEYGVAQGYPRYHGPQKHPAL